MVFGLVCGMLVRVGKIPSLNFFLVVCNTIGFFKVTQLKREFIKQDVIDYMKYFNLERLQSANDELSPVEFEYSELKVSNLG